MTSAAEPPAGQPHSPDRSPLRVLWSLVTDTVATCIRNRVLGLAAEAAFFTILSLPPLIFGLAGTVGFVANRFDANTVTRVRDQVLELAGGVLSTSSVEQVIRPTLDDVLSEGRFSIISIGFLIALWSGSRALNVFVDTIAIMYGYGGQRSIVATRALSFGLYVMFLVAGAILLPLVLAGPGFVNALLPDQVSGLGQLYWPIVLLLSVCVLATLYHLASPVRTPWRADLPGGVLALAIWVAGSVLLRLVLDRSTAGTTIYGPLAAPIAVLLWLYVIALAVLVGAGFNAAVTTVFPAMLSGARQKMAERRRRVRRFRRQAAARRPD